MFIYIIVFIISCICCEIVQKNENNKKIKVIFSILAILIPSILAGMRALEIGTDVKIYVVRLFANAKNMNLFEFLQYSEVEVGYSLLVYFSTLISKDVHIILFLNELIIIIFVYLFAYDKRNKNPIWLTMAVFFFVIYNSSLNLIRQTIAISIILYSLTHIEKKHYKRTILLFLLAMTFHRTTIFAIPLYLILYFYNNEKIKYKKVIVCVTLVMLLLVVLNYQTIMNFATYNLKIIPDKYFKYFVSLAQEFDINYFELIYKVFWLGGFIVLYKLRKGQVKDEIPYFVFGLIDFVLFPISFSIKNADRMGYYYLYPALLTIVPSLRNIVKDNKVKKVIIYIAMVGLLILYWYRIYVMLGFAETYPYKSEIFKFLNF